MSGSDARGMWYPPTTTGTWTSMCSVSERIAVWGGSSTVVRGGAGPRGIAPKCSSISLRTATSSTSPMTTSVALLGW